MNSNQNEESNQTSRVSISSNDLPALVLTIGQCSTAIDQDEGDVLKHLERFFLGLSSHGFSQRKGYVLIVNYLLEKYRGRIEEERAVSFIESLKFGKDKQKTAARTITIAKILTSLSFIKSQIIVSPIHILAIISEIHEISLTKPNLAPIALTVLAEIQSLTNFQFLEQTMNLLKPSLDSFIFIFKVSNVCPEEFRQFLPPSFQPSTYNDHTSQNLAGQAFVTKQPWNSDIWKVIANETPKEELFTFWQQVLSKFIRSTEPTCKQNLCAIYIVRSVLPTLKPDVYDIIISAPFIKMVNSLIVKPAIQPQINDFLNFVVDLSNNNKQILPHIIDSFAHIDFRQPGGFEFHLNLLNNCTQQELNCLFEKIRNFHDNDRLEFEKRHSSQKVSETALSKYKLDTLRAVFISSGRFKNPSFTLSVFDYICDTWKENLRILVPDIVKYDTSRIDGSATLSQLAKDPTITSFAACYKLCSLCTGASSSPSLNTLIAPEIDTTRPSTDFILMAIQRANESVLIAHAFKTYLKAMIPQIPVQQIEQFFADFVPLTDSFTVSTLDIFDIVIRNMKTLNYNIMAPLFNLFCKIITNIGGSLIQPSSDFIKNILHLISNQPQLKNSGREFNFEFVMNSIFTSFTSLSQKVVKQNQRAIDKTFEMVFIAVVRAAEPLCHKYNMCLRNHLEEAVCDYAYKSTQHFDESFFAALLKLPDDINHMLFPILMKHLANVQRVQRRVHLIDLVSLIFNQKKGVEVIIKYYKEFNECILALLNENFMSKEDEKKFLKFLLALTKWFNAMDKKRDVSSRVNIGDFKRRLGTIQTQAPESLSGALKSCFLAMQRIENQVHPKQRMF